MRIRAFTVAAAALGLGSISGCGPVEQGEPAVEASTANLVEGHVVHNHEPIGGALVQIMIDGAVHEALTDLNGYFAFSTQLKPGAEVQGEVEFEGIKPAGFITHVGESAVVKVEPAAGEKMGIIGQRQFALDADDYAGDSAADYAENYWRNGNGNFTDFSSYGGDCTNFASQAILAGLADSSNGWTVYSARRDYQDDGYSGNDWWYSSSRNRAMPEWAGADGLYTYLKTQGNNPRYSGLQVQIVQRGGGPDPSEYEEGDIISLVRNGDAYHSMVVVNEGWWQWSTKVAYRNSDEGSPARKAISRLSRDARQDDWWVFRPTGFED